mmetsp:Transcript_27946/g.59024  ORF Transcript_27946/g.59024 Transcript_27946/m.59024 type:complete len:227 (+) Transcript_27946:755-1435(+)
MCLHISHISSMAPRANDSGDHYSLSNYEGQRGESISCHQESGTNSILHVGNHDDSIHFSLSILRVACQRRIIGTKFWIGGEFWYAEWNPDRRWRRFRCPARCQTIYTLGLHPSTIHGVGTLRRWYDCGVHPEWIRMRVVAAFQSRGCLLKTHVADGCGQGGGRFSLHIKTIGGQTSGACRHHGGNGIFGRDIDNGIVHAIKEQTISRQSTNTSVARGGSLFRESCG